jgi:hypothetical protein
MQVTWRIDVKRELLREQANKENAYLFSNALREHTSRGLGGDSCMFRIGSRAFVELFAEIRMLSEAGAYVMNEKEKFLVEETELGEGGRFEGSIVPLDLPMMEGEADEHSLNEAEYQGRKVPLGKPMQGDVAKSKVYVKDPKTGNVKKVNFGDPNMKIKKSNPERRKSFRARHNCDNPGPRTKARYWSCRAW